MAEKTKIMLSESELDIVKDTGWILTKYSIIKKVYELFQGRVEGIKSILALQAGLLPAELITAVPKINKGENYRQFPYVIMDYPAVFSKENIFAVRTMFWWGHFFSITLHLSGTYKKIYEQRIFDHLISSPENFYVCTGESEWQHYFEPDNYIAVEGMSKAGMGETREKTFIKIALKYDLQQWNSLHQLLDEDYKKLFDLLKD